MHLEGSDMNKKKECKHSVVLISDDGHYAYCRDCDIAQCGAIVWYD